MSNLSTWKDLFMVLLVMANSEHESVVTGSSMIIVVLGCSVPN